MADGITQIGTSKVLELFRADRMQKVERSMINKTTRSLKKDSENKISGMEGQKGVFNIAKKRVKQDTDLKLMGRQATKSEASVTFKGDRPSLQHFSNNKKLIKKTKSPKVRIKKNKPLETVDRGFPLNKAGEFGRATGIFQRKGKASIPIVRRTGPSVRQMYEDPEVRIPVEKKKDVNQEANFKTAFDAEFGGKK